MLFSDPAQSSAGTNSEGSSLPFHLRTETDPICHTWFSLRTAIQVIHSTTSNTGIDNLETQPHTTYIELERTGWAGHVAWMVKLKNRCKF